MKALYLKTLFAMALAVTLSSCEKKAEDLQSLSEKAIATTSESIYPLVGTELSNSILPKRKLPRAVLTKSSMSKSDKVKLIDTVCEEYVKGTTKFDLSGLTAGVHVTKITHNDLTIVTNHEGDFSELVKLNNGPKGWWTHWNYSPYTESEYPDVLFGWSAGYPASSMALTFDKYVTSFGFEIAPNDTGKDHYVTVEYNNIPSYKYESLFKVRQTISSPSGARLIAVKSEVPFKYVQINVQYLDGGSGFAISNLRYALAK
jgi:hypothetical protein